MAQLAAAGRLVLAPFTGMASWYNRVAQSHPLTVGVITTGLKTSAADVFAQKVGALPRGRRRRRGRPGSARGLRPASALRLKRSKPRQGGCLLAGSCADHPPAPLANRRAGGGGAGGL